LPVGREPGIEQAGTLQRRLDPSTLPVADRRPEIDQLPQRRTGAVGAYFRIAGIRCRRPHIDTAFQLLALVLQRRALALQLPATPIEHDAALGGSHIVPLPRHLKELARRIVAAERAHPLGQGRHCGVPALGAGGELPEIGEVALPRRDQGPALGIHRLVGTLASGSGGLDGRRLLVAHLAALSEHTLRRRHLCEEVADQRNVLAALGGQGTEP
jgi:hypothetical protein